MKKLTFLILILIVSVTISEAQIFVGGSFGLSTSGGSIDDGTTSTDKTSNTSISFTPRAGYILSEKFWVGMQIGIGTTKEKNPGTPEVVNKTTQFGFTPFARYYVVNFNKLALSLQGDLGINFSSSKSESGGTTVDGPKGTTIGFSVFPGISYELNDKISLETHINGFNLGFSYNSTKQDIAGTETKNKTTNFNLGANLDNILTSGAITVGAIIKL